MSEASDGGAEASQRAWAELHAAAPPELKRWLETGRPVAMHQDVLMAAVPNNFTRAQLEGRFRADIEAVLATHFGRTIQLAVIVDDTLVADAAFPDPAAFTEPEDSGEFPRSDGFRDVDYAAEHFRPSPLRLQHHVTG